MTTLRETQGFQATPSARGVRITAKERGVVTQSRVVSHETWRTLASMNDSSFDGTCVLELGIGTWKRKRN